MACTGDQVLLTDVLALVCGHVCAVHALHNALYLHGLTCMCADVQSDGSRGDLVLKDFSGDMLLYMCIMCGCDYLDQVTGVGIKKAHEIVAKHKGPPRLIRALRYT